MSFHGNDIGQEPLTEDESGPLPWETIELEEADREPQAASPQGAAAATNSQPPLRVAAEPLATASFSAAVPVGVSRDSQGAVGFRVSGFRVQAGGAGNAPRPEPFLPSDAVTRKPAPSSPLNPDTLNPEPSPTPEPSAQPSRGGGWTIPLVCFGIGLIACCVIIPQADSNRRLAYQKELLSRDLASIQNQVAVNDEFLKRVYDDGSLTERLAQRQMNVVPAGNRVWRDGRLNDAQSMSPYGLTIVPKPVPLPAYQPTGGRFAALCRDPRSNLYLIGAALMMLAAGLVMGVAPGAVSPQR